MCPAPLDSLPSSAAAGELRVEPCAQHPERFAVSVCTRCAAYLCAACDEAGAEDLEVFCPVCRPPAEEPEGPSASPEEGAPLAAGFTLRLAAYLLDGILLDAVRALVMAALGWEVDPAHALELGPPVLLALGLSLAYHVLGWSLFGATVGKAFFGLRVVRASDGGPVGWPRALLRWVGYMVSALPLGLGFLAIALDPRRRGWHDRIAGTVVMRRPR